MKYILPLVLIISFMLSCSKKAEPETFADPEILGEWLLVEIKGEGKGTPTIKPGITSFTFNDDETVNISDSGMLREDLEGAVAFDPENKQMIWIHKHHNHPPLRKPYVVDKDRLFYQNPEMFTMYFKRVE